jgi:hypothetical protein
MQPVQISRRELVVQFGSAALEHDDEILRRGPGLHPDIPSLLRILTFDAEPMVDHDGVDYYKAEDDEPSDGAEAYVAWLDKQLALRPVKGSKEVESIVKAAQERFAKPFGDWMKQYHEG